MQATFQPVQADKLDELLTLCDALYTEDGGRALDDAFARRAFAALIAQPDYGGVWFICADDARVGYMVVTFSFSIEYGGRDAIVDELYVQPSARGQGLGTQALHFAERYCQEHGVMALHLEVYDGNPALALYERVGYTRHDSTFLTKWLSEQNP